MNALNIWKGMNREKYVDGLYYFAVDVFVPCTPKGCIELLRRYNIELKGKSAFVFTESASDCVAIANLLQVNNDAIIFLV